VLAANFSSNVKTTICRSACSKRGDAAGRWESFGHGIPARVRHGAHADSKAIAAVGGEDVGM